nr:hypothetical protein [Klebsiella pneumoniae subsp. pneumoniae]
MLVENHHHIVIEYFGDLHIDPRNKNLTPTKRQVIRFCLPQQLQSNTRTVTTSAARST